ncbi:hypothetical protein Hypma_014395 [Hypsizygus marmoreus]|uniref:Uncharacterized protein n=1 Tax=Hypsizygus marmoreus TaxID=39966 RepID=A0A369JCL6_HYPMA|nr:hypothetical protein Hypma_014395 [Hypsizygus marmoreus]
MPLEIAPEDQAAIVLATTNNEVILDSLYPAVQQLIASAEQSVVQIDVEIVRVQHILRTLVGRRKKECNKIRRFKATMAPHRKLPNALLVEIFAFCTEYAVIPHGNTEAPWSLACVCARWRQVVHRTRALWSRIRTLSNNTCAWDLRFTRTIETLLARNHGSHISMDATFDGNLSIRRGSQFTEFLLSYGRRLQNLSVTASSSYIRNFIDVPPGVLQNLTTLTIRSVQFGESISHIPLIDVAPNLRHLTVGFTLHQIPSTLSIAALSHLISLALVVTVPRDVAFQILLCCASLVNCEMTIDDYPPRLVRGSVHTLPELKRLLIRVNNCNRLDWIEDLRLPRLMDFECLAESGTWQPTWTQSITGSRTLERLAINFRVGEVDLECILDSAPSLRILDMRKAAGDSISLAILSRMSVGDLAPRLEFLGCSIATSESLSWHFDMLEERRSHHTRPSHIAQVKLYKYPRHISEDIRNRFDMMNNSDWDIMLKRR